jgi:hypothetical protein
MAKQAGSIKIVGLIGPLCFYRSGDKYYVRRASSLTRKRVKYDPLFHRTMMNARLLGRASKIASVVYKDLPKNFRQYWMYRAFTGEAMQLLKAGKTDDEARETLWHVYASVHHMQVEVPATRPCQKKQLKTAAVSVFYTGRAGLDYCCKRRAHGFTGLQDEQDQYRLYKKSCKSVFIRVPLSAYIQPGRNGRHYCKEGAHGFICFRQNI